MVAGLEGSAQSKKKLEVILGTLAGLPIARACEILDLTEASIHRLREEALQGALQALEPKPMGRPKKDRSVASDVVEKLQEKLEAVSSELKIAQVKEEIQVVLGPRRREVKEAEKKRNRGDHDAERAGREYAAGTC